jgi:hypothetical protein
VFHVFLPVSAAVPIDPAFSPIALVCDPREEMVTRHLMMASLSGAEGSQ